MNIFIAWSKDSEKIAEKLGNWLKMFFPTVKVTMSKGIEPGENWYEKLMNMLSNTDLGIICITKANQTSPWLNFESGALAKSTRSPLYPLLIDFNNDVTLNGPLSYIQHKRAGREGLLNLIYTVNNAMEKPREKNDLRDEFDEKWDFLEALLKEKPVEPKVNRPGIAGELFV